MKHAWRPLLALLGAGSLALTLSAQQNDTLKKGFENPPNSARPLVWWHWMNGNISKDGAKLDLEWMHRVGIAGFQNFDAAWDTPLVVPQRISYMTPEWKAAFQYAIELGDKFGMEMGIAGSPGWSESGGPWVPPSHGMKKYVWSELIIDGGRPFAGKLPHPPEVTGPFQNVGSSGWNAPEHKGWSYYADAVVVAYRIPDAAADVAPLRVSSTGGAISAAQLSDGDLVHLTFVPVPDEGAASWILFEYAPPQTIRSLTYAPQFPNELEASYHGVAAPTQTLEASDDGVNFRKIIDLAASEAPQQTIAIPATTARYFRVVFHRTPRPARPAWAAGIPASFFGIDPNKPPKDYKIAELALHSEPRVNHLEEKANFVLRGDLYDLATPAVDVAAPSASDVVDLTSSMSADGSLAWTPPAGRWMILRFGYSLLGVTNHPATPEATGLEVDKLNRRFVRDYFEKYLDSYKAAIGADKMGARGIREVINDSWEAGSQNWTDDLPAQFKKLRGYDMTPWMPVLAGRIIGSAEQSDRFLWDFRQTISDLVASEHYGELEAILHERGMIHYGESHEGGRALPADGMQVKKYNEVPMSAMWTPNFGESSEQFTANTDIRESASVAHIYGQNLTAAESMTASSSPWAWSPATLKATIDQELLAGVNRVVIHESAHQPLVDPTKAPGLTLGPFGQWFSRNETWAELARPWIDYIARSSYMLQQGRFHADLLYYYGEGSNLTALFGGKAPDAPAGFAFDYINADALTHELSVVNGEIATRSGMRYKALYLDSYSRHMSLPVLRALHSLVEQGAVIIGDKPVDDPSLADDAAEFARLREAVFGDAKGKRRVGKGSVYAAMSIAESFAAMQLAPDFDYAKTNGGHLEFLHRSIDEGEIYFVVNRSGKPFVDDVDFRGAGREPELWRAETALVAPLSYRIADGRTHVALALEPWGSAFILFRKPTTEASRNVAPTVSRELLSLAGPWALRFQAGRGAPEQISLDALIDWSKSENAGVRYFSGSGVYEKTLSAPAEWFATGAHLWLELGEVKNLARVKVNGVDLGVTWHAPYRVDVTSALRPGENRIEIEVVNAWVNRLIGDEQPGAARIAFADVKPYNANSPLLPSGLIGPVRLTSESQH